MKRNPIPIEILRSIRDHVAEHPELRRHEVARWVKSKWPDVFLDKTTDLSTWSRIYRESATHDVPINLPRQKPIPQTNTVWAKENPELTLAYRDKVQVISDAHFAAHDRGILRHWLDVVEVWKPHYVVWNGDFLNFDHFGHKGARDAYAANFVDDLQAHAEVMNMVHEASPETGQILLQGNHDDKALRMTDGELQFDKWLPAMWEQWGCRPAGDIRLTSRYYCRMAARTPGVSDRCLPEHFPTLFAHQKEYSRVPLSVSQRLADVKWCNVVSGHHHNLGVTPHKSGKVWCAEAGTMQQAETARYKTQRPSTHPQWAVGFLLVEYGVPQVFSALNPEEWWDKQLERLSV